MTRGQPLTAVRLRQLYRYEPDSGHFFRAADRRKWKAGALAGTLDAGGRIQMYVDGCHYKAHRLAWLYMTGDWPDGEVDHINGRASDNRWSNLRIVSSGENKQNQRRGHEGSTSQYLGVSWAKRRNRWRADICVERKMKFLGYFVEEKEASEAYLRAKRELHPACTI